MKLERLPLAWQLALVQGLIVGLFLSLTWVLQPVMSRDAGSNGEERQQPHVYLGDLLERAYRGYLNSGLQGLRSVVMDEPRNAELGVVMYLPGVPPEQVWGQRRVLEDPEGLEAAWRGVGSHRVVNNQGLTVWAPQKGPDGEVQAVLAAALPPPQVDPRWVREQARIGTMKAAAVAAAFCLLVGLALSRLVADPVADLVRATRDLAEGQWERRVPQKGAGELAQLASSFNDMAEHLQQTLHSLQEEKQRVERLEASRREFLADISHNLGTPLAALGGWIQALQDGLLSPDEHAEVFHKMERELSFISRTVKRLLELSRWDGGRPELRLEEFPVVEPLMEAVEAVEAAALARGGHLEFAGVEGAFLVRGDRLRTRELFQIFLENSVIHGGDGVRVQVQLRARDDRLLVSIQDNGPGLAPDQLPDLRERFKRGSSNGGAGLGLAIASQLVSAMGGELQFKSEVGVGTTVEFTLPLRGSQKIPYEGSQRRT